MLKSKKYKKFQLYNSIGKEEIKAALKVLNSGKLSNFVASYPQGFNGGKFNNLFEKKLSKFYKVKHAILLNSWTSGLIAAIGALDINPGDEVIVSPWTMSATATAILHWGAIPVFADIEDKTFCINPKKVKQLITRKTKAIITVDIFGFGSNVDELKKIIKKKNIKIINDSAQAPYSFNKNKIVGTETDIGGYSLNCHKHIQTGEGGIIVTNNSNYAERIRLLRNHAEAVVSKKGVKNINNMVGYNFRMGEIEAAIGIEQLIKLKKIVKKKQIDAKYLIERLNVLDGLGLPKINDYRAHSFYTLPMVIDLKKIKFTRKKLCLELKKNGLEGFVEGYTNLHLLPMYQKKIAYGTKGFPWSTFKSKVNYKKGICPTAENLHDKTFINFELCKYNLTKANLEFISKTFINVWKKINQ